MCLTYAQKCLQLTYPLPPKDTGMPQKCAHITCKYMCIPARTHTLSRVGMHLHGTHTYTCSPSDISALTYLHAHKLVYLRHT